MKTYLLALVLALVLSGVAGAQPSDLALTPDQDLTQIHYGFVEDQSIRKIGFSNGWLAYCNANPAECVINSTPCLWTTDANVRFTGYGNLAASTTVSSHLCLVADAVAHLDGLELYAPSPSLQVAWSYPAQNVTFTAGPPTAYDSKTWLYRGCVVGPRYSWGDPLLTDVPGSQGGLGFMSSIDLSITNPTSHALRNVSVVEEIGSSEPGRQARYCVTDPSGTDFVLNGAFWETGL